MNSLEGRRGQPRIKPPFPAVVGAFGRPTTINNVETLSVVPHIIANGAEWYKRLGTGNERSRGTKLFSVCGNIQRPGNYEVELGFPCQVNAYVTPAGAQGLEPQRIHHPPSRGAAGSVHHRDGWSLALSH